jgi:hypothetical protein
MHLVRIKLPLRSLGLGQRLGIIQEIEELTNGRSHVAPCPRPLGTGAAGSPNAAQ